MINKNVIKTNIIKMSESFVIHIFNNYKSEQNIVDFCKYYSFFFKFLLTALF